MNLLEQFIEQFIELFDGNRTAVGTEDGGCLRLSQVDMWPATISNHHLTLGGSLSIGVYPLVFTPSTYPEAGVSEGEWLVKWGCVDLDDDIEQAWAQALNVVGILREFGVTAWLEPSRSKGLHVWVFASEWMPAWIMRRALLMACTLVDAPIKEINPKSEGFDNPATLGNYVRLAYPGALGSMAPARPCVACGHDEPTPGGHRPSVRDLLGELRRTVVDDSGRPYCASCFVRIALANRCSQHQLMPLAEGWNPPAVRTQHQVNDISAEGLEDAIARVHRRTIHILMDGPNEHRDRSATLFWLGQMLVRDGLHTYDEIIALLMYADRKWGKFHDRPDFERRITDIVDKAWSEL